MWTPVPWPRPLYPEIFTLMLRHDRLYCVSLEPRIETNISFFSFSGAPDEPSGEQQEMKLVHLTNIPVTEVAR